MLGEGLLLRPRAFFPNQGRKVRPRRSPRFVDNDLDIEALGDRAKDGIVNRT
jgi:hypothetical protein